MELAKMKKATMASLQLEHGAPSSCERLLISFFLQKKMCSTGVAASTLPVRDRDVTDLGAQEDAAPKDNEDVAHHVSGGLVAADPVVGPVQNLGVSARQGWFMFRPWL